MLGLSGCLLETETAIKSDATVDARLEGVWQIAEKLPNEIRGDRDEDDVGVYGYIIIAALEGQDDTYKALAFDSFEADTPSKFPEMLVSTRKHKGHNLLLGGSVHRGQKIGTVGNAQGLYFAHLHFELHESDGVEIGAGYSFFPSNRYNPIHYIEHSLAQDSPEDLEAPSVFSAVKKSFLSTETALPAMDSKSAHLFSEFMSQPKNEKLKKNY